MGGARFDPEAVTLDRLLDRHLSATNMAVENAAVLHQEAPGGSDETRAVARLPSRLFPQGVGAITSQRFVEQSASVSTILQMTSPGGELSVAAIRRKPDPSGPTVDDRRAANAAFQRALRFYVVSVLARYGADDEEPNVRARARLLEPIQAQQERLGELYRGRRGVRDVDPLTGVEIDTSARVNDTPPS